MADFKAGADNHTVNNRMQSHANKGDQTHRMGPGAAIVIAVIDIQVDMVLLFMPGVDQQVMLKKIKDDKCEDNEQRGMGGHLQRFRQDVENADAEQDPC